MSSSEHVAGGGSKPGGSVPEGPVGEVVQSKRALGAYGEELAVRHLQEAGLEILDRNWRCPDGELDVVALEDTVLVVCEVKTRSGREYGLPLEAVTAEKAERLRRLAVRWLAEHRRRFAEVRFDVIGVLCVPGEGVRLEHTQGVC